MVKMKKCIESGLTKLEARKQVFSSGVHQNPCSVKRTRDGDQGSSGEYQAIKRMKENLCPKLRAGLFNSDIQR